MSFVAPDSQCYRSLKAVVSRLGETPLGLRDHEQATHSSPLESARVKTVVAASVPATNGSTTSASTVAESGKGTGDGTAVKKVPHKMRVEQANDAWPDGAILQVSGAGNSEFNGFYKAHGMHNGKPDYWMIRADGSKGAENLYWNVGSWWMVMPVDDDEPEIFYKADGDADLPPASGWFIFSDMAKLPAPTVLSKSSNGQNAAKEASSSASSSDSDSDSSSATGETGGKSDNKPDAVPGGAAGGSKVPKASPWVKKFSEEYGLPFWWNIDTSESVWEEPAELNT